MAEDEQRPRARKDDGSRGPRRYVDGDRSARPFRGDRSPSSGDAPRSERPRRDGDRPHRSNDGADRPRREGDRPFRSNSGADRPRRDGDRPFRGNDDRPRREGDRPFRSNSAPDRPRREGDRPFRSNSGTDRPRREGDRPFRSNSGTDRPRRDGDRPFRSNSGTDRPRRDGDRPFRSNSGTDRPRRDGDRPFRSNDDRPRRDGDRPFRSNDDRPRRAMPAGDRPRDPEIPEDVTARDLHPSARNELKTLSKENAENVARHLAMAGRLLDDDPALAHEHALAASRRAGRVAVVRESVAITAYAMGDFALALRELRTYRRISGNDDQIALIVDSERGMGRPDRALEEARSVDRAALPTATRVALAIAMSGARLDRGETELALGELEIPELNPDLAFEWSPALFAARAAVLEDLGRSDEAAFWQDRADVAAAALGHDDDELIVEDVYEDLPDEDEEPQEEDPQAEPQEEHEEPSE
jgi:hypothetical protein